MDDPFPLTPAVQILAGLLILFFGRRLFWIFVGVVGFFFGLQFGMKAFAGMTEELLLLVSIVIGIICAGLAVLLQRVAVAAAGGFAGGMLAIRLAPIVGLHTQEGLWVAFIAGGLFAAVLLSVLFDPALVILSTITGAMMLAEALPMDPMIEPIVFCLCFLIGIIVQMRLGKRALPSRAA